MLCICSPSEQEKFFMEVGVPVATRTTPPPNLGEKEEAAFIEKVKANGITQRGVAGENNSPNQCA
jgi:hypothetical protein